MTVGQTGRAKSRRHTYQQHQRISVELLQIALKSKETVLASMAITLAITAPMAS